MTIRETLEIIIEKILAVWAFLGERIIFPCHTSALRKEYDL